MNIKRVNAIFIKELQDIRTNWNQLFLYLVPILLTFIYSKILPSNEMPKGYSLSVGLLMLVIMAGISITAMMIAEEKEKRTLEVLLLSPATPREIFLGKSLVIFLSIIVSMLILMIIDNNNWNSLPIILLSTILISTFCIIFGIIVGIFSKNQMSTGIVGTPLMFLFLLPPMFSVLGVKQMDGIARIVPSYYYLDILKKVTYDASYNHDILYSFGLLVGSIAIASMILFIVVKRKGFE